MSLINNCGNTLMDDLLRACRANRGEEVYQLSFAIIEDIRTFSWDSKTINAYWEDAYTEIKKQEGCTWGWVNSTFWDKVVETFLRPAVEENHMAMIGVIVRLSHMWKVGYIPVEYIKMAKNEDMLTLLKAGKTYDNMVDALKE